MNKRKWFQKKENITTCLQIALIMLLPWICCAIYCAMQGKTIAQVYLPCSEWNDELFYYKQVEGIVKYGFPQGYFGFNESHALKLSFAAWSPVLVFPWVIWGKLFGWTLLSPILCNLVLMTLSMGLFVLFAKPTWKQEAVLALLFCLFTPYVRYLLSGMPEIICFSMLILFYGIAIKELRKHSWPCMIAMFVMGVVMTLMRPYLILFLLLPCILLIMKNWKWGLPVSMLVLGLSLALYGMIKHFLGAEYFADLFFTDWIKAFFERGIFGGTRYTLGKLYYMGKDFCIHVVEGCRSGLASGAFFAGFMVMMGILLWQTILDFKECGGIAFWKKQTSDKAEKESLDARRMLVVEAHLLLSFVGMFFALLLMYKLTEGSKHLLTFLSTGIFIVAMMRTRHFLKPLLLCVTFLYFYVFMARAPYDYQVPFLQPQRQEQVQAWQEKMQEKMTLSEKPAPNYDNVVIWVLSDQAGDGQMKNTLWQLFYAMPKGMGISCCKDDFIKERLLELKSKYLATISGGTIDGILSEKGYKELSRDADLVLYQLR